ncbi:MAG: hypothetical protein K0S47_1284 [Herbinix sp.]|jgi:ketosteroid isomerase-like protein|nr:hypothetical protein [Herbinix sp.]
MKLYDLPQIILDFITATNKPDPIAYVECFHEDAIVWDEGEKRQGKAAILEWSDKHQFAVNVRIKPKQYKMDMNKIIVTFQLDGDYDKTG